MLCPAHRIIFHHHLDASQWMQQNRTEASAIKSKKEPRAITGPWTCKTCIRFLREIRACPFLGGKVQNSIRECICDVQQIQNLHLWKLWDQSSSVYTFGGLCLGLCLYGWKLLGIVFIGGWQLQVWQQCAAGCVGQEWGGRRRGLADQGDLVRIVLEPRSPSTAPPANCHATLVEPPLPIF